MKAENHRMPVLFRVQDNASNRERSEAFVRVAKHRKGLHKPNRCDAGDIAPSANDTSTGLLAILQRSKANFPSTGFRNLALVRSERGWLPVLCDLSTQLSPEDHLQKCPLSPL